MATRISGKRMLVGLFEHARHARFGRSNRSSTR